MRPKNRQISAQAVASLIRTLEARDPYTSGHSRRVRRYAVQVAEVLELDRCRRRQVSVAAALHDIGKVGIPEVILNKPSALGPEEYRIVQQHPIVGEHILRPLIRDRAVLAGIRSHHERLDGTGYPDGLAGTEIPWIARLVAVADCFDALTSSRPYRAGLPAAQALDVLRREAGQQFDGRFVEALAAVVGHGPGEDIQRWRCPSTRPGPRARAESGCVSPSATFFLKKRA